MGAEKKTHVLIFPFPSQGHINPMLQFAKRLLPKELEVSLLTTIYFMNSSMEAQTGSIKVEKITDGYDQGWKEEAGSTFQDYIDRFKSVGSDSLFNLFQRLQSSENPVDCIVYDAFLPWALDVAKEVGVYAGAFFTQSCAVDAIYHAVYMGDLVVPLELKSSICLPGQPEFQPGELPTFIYLPDSYPAALDFLVAQYANLEKADCVLCNSFDELEGEVASWMKAMWNVKTIGPTLPSFYIDKRLPDDEDYGWSLWKKETHMYQQWLDDKGEACVVYVSFGSLASLAQNQMEEIGWGLMDVGVPFLWVVRASEEGKLSDDLVSAMSAKGKIVRWCSQLEVLAHPAVGCFVTHCGWNSTLEAISVGVPMVTVPRWSDQPTNAKYVEEVWGVGLRTREDGEGVIGRDEVERCVREVMLGERGKEVRSNALKWKELARLAMEEGGSSDNNIQDFVATVFDWSFSKAMAA